MRGKTEYQIKINDTIVKQTANHKEAKTIFRKERARHGGKVKFFQIRVK